MKIQLYSQINKMNLYIYTNLKARIYKICGENKESRWLKKSVYSPCRNKVKREKHNNYNIQQYCKFDKQKPERDKDTGGK